jgi:chromosome segregation ATPase
LRNEVNQLKVANRESLNTSEELESTLRSQIASLEKSLSESGDQSSVRLGELEASLSRISSEKRSLELDRENFRAALASKTEQVTSLISRVNEIEKTNEELQSSQENLSRDKDNLEKRLEKAKEYFNTKRIEDEAKLTEFESLKQSRAAMEKKLSLCAEEAAGLKDEISRLASEISRSDILLCDRQ